MAQFPHQWDKEPVEYRKGIVGYNTATRAIEVVFLIQSLVEFPIKL